MKRISPDLQGRFAALGTLRFTRPTFNRAVGAEFIPRTVRALKSAPTDVSVCVVGAPRRREGVLRRYIYCRRSASQAR